MTYSETIDYLFEQLPMFSRIGVAAYKKDLTNTLLLCELLGNPHKHFKSIHVAGTNGKGSTSHMLASVMQQAGYKTGLYTSPHLHDFRERIRINGAMVPEQFVVDFVEKIKPAIAKIQPSFFEITVAMAFDFFAKEEVDVAVVEVGLGGRLDSTNVVIPELSVITNIGWDHMNMLGNSLEEIAFEKAGIIKEKIPVVIGEVLPETKPVFEKVATEKSAPILYAEDHLQIHSVQQEIDSLQLVYQKNDETISLETDLAGLYQSKNVRTALAATQILKDIGWNISDEMIQSGLKQVKTLTGLKGRWDVIRQNPLLVLDVAHNKEGIEQLLLQIKNLSYKNLHIITGMVRDKDSFAVLNQLPAEARYYFTQANIPRALNKTELKDQAEAFGLKGNSFNNVNEAIIAALANAEKEDLIVVCGSVFLVAEVDEKLFQ